MKAGPKAAVDPTVLPFRPRSLGAARFAKFCERYVKVPKGTGARTPLRPRDWRRDLVASVLDADPQPRTAGWMLPRGQGKSSLMALGACTNCSAVVRVPRFALSLSMSGRPASCSTSPAAWWSSTTN